VAYLDFKDKIASERHVLPNVGAFLREEGNYFVRISKIAKAYEVAFIPRPTPEIPEFRGGGMEYIIDESSYEIRASARMK
jgi:hypothetical protein